MASEAATAAATAAGDSKRDGSHDLDLDQVLSVAVEAAKAGGAIIAASYDDKEGFDVFSKGGVDMVTTVDKASEKAVLDIIRAAFPDHKIIAEESSATEPLSDKPTWLVDPLDGTTNFVHGYPFVATSIGFASGGKLLVGVVYNPIMNELFTARHGGGAFLNGKAIHVGKAAAMSDALVVNNIGAGRDPAFITKSLACVEAVFLKHVHSVRMTGSAAINMCHVACGKVDAYWELKVGGSWDLAAGAVIMREAGGVVALPDGAEFDVTNLGILCGNAAMCDALGAMFAPIMHPGAAAATTAATAAAGSK